MPDSVQIYIIQRFALATASQPSRTAQSIGKETQEVGLEAAIL